MDYHNIPAGGDFSYLHKVRAWNHQPPSIIPPPRPGRRASPRPQRPCSAPSASGSRWCSRPLKAAVAKASACPRARLGMLTLGMGEWKDDGCIMIPICHMVEKVYLSYPVKLMFSGFCTKRVGGFFIWSWFLLELYILCFKYAEKPINYDELWINGYSSLVGRLRNWDVLGIGWDSTWSEFDVRFSAAGGIVRMQKSGDEKERNRTFQN